jgi:hypothetical protein
MLKRLGATACIICLKSADAFSFPNQPLVVDAPTCPSHVEIFDPTTNTNIVLLGCLHGTISSSRDVRYLMEKDPTDAVVLELCETRIEDLGRETVDEYTMDVFLEDVQDFWKFIQGTSEKKGPFVAAITFVLGITGLLQSNISGTKAGLEFAVALDIAEENGCTICLGDRGIDQTMERIGNIPSVALEMIKNNTVLQYTYLLKTAVVGDELLSNDTQISLPKVLVRNKGAVTDLGRLVLSPILIATCFALSVGSALNLPLYAQQDSLDLLLDTVTLTTFDERLPIVLKIISTFLAKFVVFAAGYTVLALPFSKVIIHERDVYLAEEIRKACGSILDSSGGLRESRIVAVLGLLHVNGVAKQLLDSGAISMQSKIDR